MVSFSTLDISIIIGFFLLVIIVGFIPKVTDKSHAENYLLSGRKIGLFLFVLTNVATWYGGILGVGEFTYKYGLVSWFTQGFPYYIFAIIFALFFAGKIRKASLFTIPDKLENTYGRGVGLISAVLIFLLVSPAPYLLMVGNLIELIFQIDLMPALLIGIGISVSYLFRGGYKSDVYTDALEFFVMFIGFILIVSVAVVSLGGIEYLEVNLPPDHLSFTGGTSPTFIIVWFLIALWTFTDPGFHQRCYAAKSEKVAKYGIIISVFFWIIFDFLTTTTGLYARANFPNLSNPVLAFPILAEELLGPGLKGIFYAALFATILSTLNSFLFLSATTFGRDFVYKLRGDQSEKGITKYTRIGLLVASILSVGLAYSIDSVIEIWYMIGTVCIPGIVFLVIGAYEERFQVSHFYAVLEIVSALSTTITWLILRPQFSEGSFLSEIEPMIVGMLTALVIHIIGMIKSN